MGDDNKTGDVVLLYYQILPTYMKDMYGNKI